MKNLTKYDWSLILSGLIIVVYCWIAMINGVVNGWFFRSESAGWFGSLPSILVGVLLLLFWIILALVRVVTLSREAYKELNPEEKKFVARVARNATQEFLRRMRRRKDRLGKIVRLGDRLTREI